MKRWPTDSGILCGIEAPKGEQMRFFGQVGFFGRWDYFFDERQVLTCQKQRKKRCIKQADILKLHSNRKSRRIPQWLINLTAQMAEWYGASVS